MENLGPKEVQHGEIEGKFRCPKCRELSPYKHIENRRFFNVFGIKLFPMGPIKHRLQCQRCKEIFGPEILHDLAVHRSQVNEAKLRCMISIMLADGFIENEEIETIKAVFKQIAGEELSDNDVMSTVSLLRKTPRATIRLLLEIEPHIEMKAKSNIIKAAALVAQSDAVVDPKETKELKSFAKALDISPEGYAAIMSEFIQYVMNRRDQA